MSVEWRYTKYSQERIIPCLVALMQVNIDSQRVRSLISQWYIDFHPFPLGFPPGIEWTRYGQLVTKNPFLFSFSLCTDAPLSPQGGRLYTGQFSLQPRPQGFSVKKWPRDEVVQLSNESEARFSNGPVTFRVRRPILKSSPFEQQHSSQLTNRSLLLR